MSLTRRKVWVLLICCMRTITGYYHEPSKDIYSYAYLTKDSYFGYSISYQTTTGRLIVGAPKANITGQVFTIDMDSNEIHTPKPVDTPEILTTSKILSNSSLESHKTFLYGAGVKAGPNFFVACAPRYNVYTTKYELISFEVKGLCFKYPLNSKEQLLKGILNFDAPLKPFGWSIDITKTNDILIGAPPTFSGNVAVVSDKGSKLLPTTDVDYYFGYSVASGNYFNKTDITSLYYAVSTPAGLTGYGKLLFFNNDNVEHNSEYTIEDYNVGSLFGGSLCTVNLGGRLDYLLVGAPLYSEDSFIDHGAVHLYIWENTHWTLHKTINGPSPTTAYFGYSIANLGDMDRDFMDEVAIAAPYEDEGRGAVYIYSGARLLDPSRKGNDMLIQRIQPEQKDNILSFGLSLASIQDYDENGCNELAVGAPETNVVIVYKCFVYMTITKLEAIFPIKTDPQENKQKVVFKTCFTVEYPKKLKTINETIRLQVKVTHPDIWFLSAPDVKTNTKAFDIPISKELEVYCNDVEVATAKNANFEEPITYTITASLIENSVHISEFKSSHVKLSPRSHLYLTDKASFADCKGQTCEPQLSVRLRQSTNLYTVGWTSEAFFAFVVNNQGDTAYTACVVVEVKGAPILSFPPVCTREGAKSLKCTPAILLKSGTEWDTGNIILDTRGLTSKDAAIDAPYRLYNRCNNRLSPVGSGTIKYVLKSDTKGINIESMSDPGDFVDVFSQSSRARHIYTITNSGPTTWKDVTVDFTLIEKESINYENVIVETEDETQVSCKISNNANNGQLPAVCNSVDFKKNSKVKIIIPFKVTVDGNSASETHNVTTTMHLRLKKRTKTSSATTRLQFIRSTVPLWVILLASLLALLLLILLAYALFTLGFLKREKKGKLVALKKSVYRQSMHRTSMRHSRRPSAGDDTKEECKELCDKTLEQEESEKNENEIL